MKVMRMIKSFFVGVIMTAIPLLLIFKIYTDNLNHVACKMYNDGENKSKYQYVQKQFGC